jgi:predicted transcriptional regulator
VEENVRIVITGNNKDALNKLNKVEDAVNRLNSATKKVEVKVSGIQEAERQAARLYQALERLESAALSKLPQSLQTVIAYLKAANAGLGEFTRRAITAAAAVGDIGRVPFAPIIKAQSQAIRQFQQMERGLVSLRVEFVKVFDRGSTQPLLDGLNLVRVSILETKGLLEGRGDFTRPILDGLDLVKVRIIEIKGLLGGLGGTGGGGRIPPAVPPNAPQLPPGVPGGALARTSDVRLPIKTIESLERLRSKLEEVYRTTEIGTPKFKQLEEQIAQLTKEIQDSQ